MSVSCGPNLALKIPGSGHQGEFSLYLLLSWGIWEATRRGVGLKMHLGAGGPESEQEGRRPGQFLGWHRMSRAPQTLSEVKD